MTSTRRAFLKLLSFAPFADLGAVRTARAGERLALDEFPVAGLRYYATPEMLATMRPGDAVEITAEPENPHDPFAVRLSHPAARSATCPGTGTEPWRTCCGRACACGARSRRWIPTRRRGRR